MSSPEQYTPRSYSELDWIAAAKRTADAILRSNPLTNAVIGHGLMRWTGNHTDVNGDKVDYLWIGDFQPNDPTLGGIPQKGIVMRRDDSTASGVNDGRAAFLIYDHDPGGGGLGLRQTLHLWSLDGIQLFEESRQGGQSWPEFPIPMGPWGQDINLWPYTTGATFYTLWEGWANIVGRDLIAEYAGQGSAGCASEYKVLIWPNGGPAVEGPLHSYGPTGGAVIKDTIDVSSLRGQTRLVQLVGRVTNGVGRATATATSFRSYRP